MDRSRRVSLLLLILSASWAHALPANSGIVAASRVRLRQGPSIAEVIVTELPLATIATILDATADRNRIDSTREFSYCWYKIELPDGAQGWIYGQYFYPLEHEEPQVITIGGERYHLAVFREDGYLNDMPSQDQYALPCFLREKDGGASLFSIDEQAYHWLPGYQETSGREISLPGNTFLLVGNAGMSETVASVSVERRGASEVLRLKIDFSLQAGGGTYTLILTQPTRDGAPSTTIDVEDAEVQSGI